MRYVMVHIVSISGKADISDVFIVDLVFGSIGSYDPATIDVDNLFVREHHAVSYANVNFVDSSKIRSSMVCVSCAVDYVDIADLSDDAGFLNAFFV